MISVIAQTVSLIPDATVIFQILIFLSILAVLTFFVFKPVFKIIEKRHKLIVGLPLQSQKLLSDAEDMDRRYAENLAAARMEGTNLEQKLINEGDEEGRIIVAKAREQEHRALLERRTEIEEAARVARKETAARVEDVTQLIIAKVLGRETDKP